MPKITTFVLFLFFVLSLKANAETALAASPVLIELFTSQGCSSCPPAESVVNTWGFKLFQTHQALPLAFHVDYWDYLGWKDPFSSSQASDRQRAYGAFFQSNTIYTPQMVIQGQVGFNGADQARADQELTQAKVSALPPLGLTTQAGRGSIQAQVTLPIELAKHLSKDSVLCVVVFENGLETVVEQGENTGAVLKENFVVRSMQTVTLADFKLNSPEKLRLPQVHGTIPTHTGVAVWCQDPRTMQVQGLTWVYPLSKI
jgi:hypothetical protein